MRQVLNLEGVIFGRLTAKQRVIENEKVYWICNCSCGSQAKVLRAALRAGYTKSCGCHRKELISARKKGKPYQWLFTIFQHYVTYRGKVSTLTFDEFIEFTKTTNCHYCSAPVTWIQHSSNKADSKAFHLDRKDNHRGYSVENCVVCCYRCNVVKSSQFSYEEMLKLGHVLAEINLQRNISSIGIPR